MLEPIQGFINKAPYVKVKLYPGHAEGTIGMEVQAGATSVVVAADLDYDANLEVIKMELESMGLTQVHEAPDRLHFSLIRDGQQA